MAVLIPHFDIPFRFDSKNHAVVIQQDTEDDIINCVHAAVRTMRGTRYYVPNFGITDPTFQIAPIDTSLIEREVLESEPRADLMISQTVAELIDTLRIGVGAGG